MKLLHTSDWHLGASEGTRSLLDDQRFFIDEIGRIVEEENIDAVLIAGDIFDRSVSSEEAIKLYDYAMTKLCLELNKPVLVIAGNHDGSMRLSNCNKLLEKSGLFISGALKRETDLVKFDDTEVFLLPWFTETKVKSLFPEKQDEIKGLTEAFTVVVDNIRSSFTAGKRHILLSHAFITDSETSTSDRAAEIGFATQVPASVFDDFDYVALGHIHKPQDVNDHIRYCGTPMPYSFGKEEKQEKSVTIIETQSMTRTIIPIPLLHKRTTLSGTLEELLNPGIEDDVLNGYTRLQVTDSYVGLSALAELGNVYSNILDVSGKTFEGENTTINLTLEEFEKMETDPTDVFRYFCKEVIGEEPDKHLVDLFEEAVKKTEEEIV